MDYDKDVFNITDGFDSDEVKINPDFYIHTAIISAQKSILLSTMDGKVSDGINAYTVFVKQIQMIAESAGYIKTADTVERIKKVDSEEANTIVDRARKSSEMLGIILQEIFGHKPNRGSLTLNPKKLSFEKNNDEEED